MDHRHRQGRGTDSADATERYEERDEGDEEAGGGGKVIPREKKVKVREKEQVRDDQKLAGRQGIVSLRARD